MDFTLWQYIIAIVGGFLAGSINTLAGNGSAITLSILTEVLGLPGNLANGTNRVGILSQSIVGNWVFHKNGKLKIGDSKLIIISVTVGALIGVYVATQVSNEQFKGVFKFLMLVMLVVILVNPKRWLIESAADKGLHPLIGIPVFLALGFYGGFIQMGMGIIFLATMVLIAKYNIIEANAVKIFVVGLYTLIIIWIFHFNGMIDWKVGAILAIGQTIGGYLTAQFATRNKNAEIWAYRLLVIIVVGVVLKMFGVFG